MIRARHLDLIVLFILTFSRCYEGKRNNRNSAHNQKITELLDSLLQGYDKHLRPGFGGPPITVVTNILIRSMGPISEEMMMFSMDCYFRQYWRDERLKFTPPGNITVLRPSIRMLDEIWKPDTFFLNGQDSYLHTITYSNKLFRIDTVGEITYSQRLTIKSNCPMFLHKYPMDQQSCPLMFGSYGYTSKDVLYRWSNGSLPVKKYKDITMAQFALTKISHGNKTMGQNHGAGYRVMGEGEGVRSILHVEFELRREIGYYLLQIYLPCYLITIISWVSFWINREATPARVTLGITTLLTTCTIAITCRTGIPKVSYSTALDIFLLMCFSFVFAALVEYAGVNYFTKIPTKEVPEDSEEESDDPEPDTQNGPKETDPQRPLLTAIPKFGVASGEGIQHNMTTDINGHTVLHTLPASSSAAVPTTSGLSRRLHHHHHHHPHHPAARHMRDNVSCWTMFIYCLKGNTKYRNYRAKTKGAMLSVSKIDTMARVIFPFSFTCLNILYWAGFLYYF